MRRFLLALCTALAMASSAVADEPAGEGVNVRKSRFLLLPASLVEGTAGRQYSRMMSDARRERALNVERAKIDRLRSIAGDLIPHAARFNADAKRWRWEVNLISSRNVNAYCMPGGKVAFYTGILDRLELTDAEVAAVMGHEIAHALLEHGRARMSEQVLKSVGITVAAVLFNLSDLSATLLLHAANLALSLPHSRGHETDADLAGMELAARAGYDPRAAASVWRKMSRLAQTSGRGQPPQFLSTHPSHASRIRDIEANLPRVIKLYEASARGRSAGRRMAPARR